MEESENEKTNESEDDNEKRFIKVNQSFDKFVSEFRYTISAELELKHDNFIFFVLITIRLTSTSDLSM